MTGVQTCALPIWLVSKHGGKFLARTTSHEQLEGKVSEATFRTIIEWPSKEDALAFMKDPEYIPHLEARTKGSTSNQIGRAHV